ncbi:HNH endonuclease signature motif containing protein [Arthrobacter sp. ISL-69]|uniref:HNH endonuclease signature motif containing protein n=1 Tax=Arthrobacter sp. ISL-69 TaxID=2819113 RepID=UPI001BECE812|nr:HNH endonuclease signature motif containing protein [Arthrobacter sp. ISL-69]MBT2538608.1 DUF222 domain-containing protein [Arthrobacter sp. ISL-69]
MEALGESVAEGALRWGGLPADAAAAGQRPPVPILCSVPADVSDGGGSGDLAWSLELLKRASSTAVAEAALFNFREAADFAADIEEFSRVAEYLQVVAAGAVDRSRRQAAVAARSGSGGSGAVAAWTTGWANSSGTEAAADPETADPSASESREPDPADDGSRNAVEFLRARLRISAGEARRRIALAEAVLPRVGFTGHTEHPERPELGAALAAGTIGSRPATIITAALDRVRHHATPETTAQMEHSLTSAAEERDADFLSRMARHWVDAVDQEGTEPSEAELRHRQGAFLRQPRRGLHHLEIFATPDQYEHLLTVMNTATNPRARAGTAEAADGDGNCPADGQDTAHDDEAILETNSGDTGTADPDLDWRTRPQRLLDGLVSGCKAALASGTLPAAGGLRPQAMVTIDYRDLLDRLEHATAQGPRYRTGTGSFTFTGPVTAASVRKIACDADIIPVLLGSQGRVLDIGRTTRVFPPHIRKAITARDQGCAFPGCTIPAPWCEAHHISYWSHGGATSTDNGTLLCSHHHHLIHKEQWTIQNRAGVPWFIPPPHIDPRQKPQRNSYFRC